jgi:hypothetical protein
LLKLKQTGRNTNRRATLDSAPEAETKATEVDRDAVGTYSNNKANGGFDRKVELTIPTDKTD